MVEVYYYLPVDEVEHAVECGIRLSKCFEKEVVICGESKKCITALLNPKDDLEKYRSSDVTCVKLELEPKYCFVADKFLYQVGLNFQRAMDMYNQSIISIEKYMFGLYRLPECLVTSTIITGQVVVMDKRMDSPVLFDNSEELYMDNIIETNKEEYNDFKDAMLYSFYCRIAETGRIVRIEDTKNKIVVFYDKLKARTYTIRIPDIDKY